MEKLKYYVYSATLLGAELYSAFCGLSRHEQEEGDILYLYFMVFLFITSMALILHDIIIKGKKYNKVIFFIPLIYSLLYVIDSSLESPKLEWTTKSYQFFLFFCTPPICIASILANKGLDFAEFYKRLELFIVFIAFGMISYLPVMILAGGMIKGYLNISYQSALAFGFIYYGLLAKPQIRYAFLNSKQGRLLSLVLCILLVITCISSGGRGGVVFLILQTLLISYKYIGKANIIKMICIYIPFLIVLLFITVRLIGNSALSSVIDNGFERVFSYITSEGIDMSQASNRDEAYQIALVNINNNTLTGCGIFHTIGRYGYPHNIFIELLEGGGLFYFMMWIVILAISLRTFLLNTFRYNKYTEFIPLLLYPCTLLLFSGSYMMTGLFWFFIILTHSKNYKKLYL